MWETLLTLVEYSIISSPEPENKKKKKNEINEPAIMGWIDDECIPIDTSKLNQNHHNDAIVKTNSNKFSSENFLPFNKILTKFCSLESNWQ